MLNIYCGRENIDKQRFMFEQISGDSRYPIFLIVPDQFTLEAERSAFDYLKVSAYATPIVISISRLADRIASEVGGSTEHIDKYGKYMLLARILFRGKGTYELFKNYESSSAFIEKLSDAITSLKRHLVTPEDLSQCIENMEKDSILKRKCSDILSIYEKYESQIIDSVPDNIDIIKMMAKKIKDSEQIQKASIWVSGFDYFSPLDLDVIIKLAARAEDVNVLLTAERGDSFFSLTNGLAGKLMTIASDEGVVANILDVPDSYKYIEEDKRPEEIKHIEDALYSYPLKTFDGANKDKTVVKFVMASNFHSEAEAAASEISKLIREEGLKFNEILVLCNDVDKRSATIKRVFEEYGLNTFMDRRRDVDHNPVLEFILALPEIISNGKKREDIFRWIKTGLSGVDASDAEELENYSQVYNLRGKKWGDEITLGAEKYDDDTFERIKRAASYINSKICEFESLFSAGKTGQKRTEGLHKFLTECCNFPDAIEEYADKLEQRGFVEYSDELRGIWEVVEELFMQINSLMGNLSMSVKEYATVLKVGFESIKIGMLPHTADSILIGTMQRTRINKIKALFVLGANDGELPLFSTEEGLLSDEEKEELEKRGIVVGRRDDNLKHEEELAIYKNLSKPSRMLYMSYTVASPDGKESKASMVFEKMRSLFPDIALEKDTDVIDYLFSEKSTFARLSKQIRDKFSGKEIDGIWNDLWLWYENNTTKTEMLIKGLSFSNREEEIGGNNIFKLLSEEVDTINISPSAIEKYSRCQFAFLMDYGLRLKEIREYAIDSRNMGDIYHEVLSNFGIDMCLDKKQVRDSDSKWNTINEEETNALIEKIFTNVASNYQDGLFEIGKSEQYRRDRLKRIVKDVAWALVEKIRCSATDKIEFEMRFGKGGPLSSINININNYKVNIAGRIDRIDVLDGKYAKVLDYKSGSDEFDMNDVLNGWQMQLMIYLKAVSSKYIPAGVSYFKIFEPHENLDSIEGASSIEEIKEFVQKKYLNDGIVVSELEEANGNTGEKSVAPDEFENLLKTTDEILADLAKDLTCGKVLTNPKAKSKGGFRGEVTACTYCNYRSICNYDEAFAQ